MSFPPWPRQLYIKNPVFFARFWTDECNDRTRQRRQTLETLADEQEIMNNFGGLVHGKSRHFICEIYLISWVPHLGYLFARHVLGHTVGAFFLVALTRHSNNKKVLTAALHQCYDLTPLCRAKAPAMQNMGAYWFRRGFWKQRQPSAAPTASSRQNLKTNDNNELAFAA